MTPFLSWPTRFLPLGAISAAILLSPSTAQAVLVTNTSGFSNPIVTTNFNPIAANTTSGGPLQFNTSNGDLIEFSSTYSDSVINYSAGYGFSSNGFWDFPLIMAGFNEGVGYMDFKFLGGTVSAAGGFLNYAPGFPDDMYIAALDGAGNVLETYDLSFATGGGFNTGANYYIQRSNADIATLRLGDSYVSIANFTYNAPAPVPGPLPLVGVAAAFGYSRRLRKRVAAGGR